MLPWMAAMMMSGCYGSASATNQKQKKLKKKKDKGGKPDQKMSQQSHCDQSEPARASPWFVPNVLADQVEMQLENAFKVASQISLSHFGSSDYFSKRWVIEKLK